jgi:hypothetical protein
MATGTCLLHHENIENHVPIVMDVILTSMYMRHLFIQPKLPIPATARHAAHDVRPSSNIFRPVRGRIAFGAFCERLLFFSSPPRARARLSRTSASLSADKLFRLDVPAVELTRDVCDAFCGVDVGGMAVLSTFLKNVRMPFCLAVVFLPAITREMKRERHKVRFERERCGKVKCASNARRASQDACRPRASD